MAKSSPNLTEIAYWTRKVIKISAIVIVSLTIGKTLLTATYKQWKNTHPSPPPPPDTLFGTLPKTRFKEKIKKPDEVYLETINNQLPTMPSQAKVYFIISKKSKILAYDLTKALAGKLGFTNEPEKLKEDLFLYKNTTLNTKLTINPITQNLEYEYAYQNDQTIINQLVPQSLDQINRKAQEFLNTIEAIKPDLNLTGQVTLYKLTATQLVKADSLSEANLARVDFFRNNIEGKTPILPPSLNRPNISVWVSGDASSHDIVKARFVYFPIDQEKYSTYPLKPISQAWKEVQAKRYHLAQLDTDQVSQKLAIRKVYLAYLDPNYPTEFLKPIYVFEGDHNFKGYVEAVSTDFLTE